MYNHKIQEYFHVPLLYEYGITVTVKQEHNKRQESADFFFSEEVWTKTFQLAEF